MARNLNGRLDRIEEAVRRAGMVSSDEERPSPYYEPIIGYPGRWGDLTPDELAWVLVVAETELRRLGRPREWLSIRQNDVLGYLDWFRFTDEVYEEVFTVYSEHGTPLDPETCTKYFTDAGRSDPLGCAFSAILKVV